ncbi:hypothetical protein [Calidifontibacillus oryziterrae]|uniref:hypothetical protein n=1 Tax=Calidifontibacillus oryziterrae TaxID=1191699 RepID=UPI0002E5A47A|nr:hypothetical protein [Calidifontibacillus oryziterrae]
MQFELWLDESGDFQSDMNLARNPSLVGGLLIPKDQIDAQTAREILGKDYVHFNQEKSSYTLQVLEMIKTNHAEFVIFENRERVKIINSDTTYLNVLAEGIIQLLLQLSAQYGDFELHILVATRKNLEQGYGIIPFEQYEQKLRERVIVGLARKALTKKNDWKYTIQFGDARDNFKLMLADGVCNTYLTRTSGKFTKTERGRIEDLYNSPYKFSFFENTVEQHIKRQLAQGKFSDALYEIYTNNELEQHDHFLEITLKRFCQLDDHSKKIQLLDISKKFETLIRIDRKYNYVKPALVKIQSELLPLLEQQQIIVPEFQLDIILFLYTIHTHEGSAAGDVLDQLSLQQIQRIEDIMTKLKYYNIYKIRRGIHEKNMLNLNASIFSYGK